MTGPRETLVDLLRHGEVAGGARFRGSLDDPLTPQGWRQMQEALPTDGGWTRIVSSPLKRCAAFADTLAQRLDLQLQVDSRLQEMHFGAWEGQTAEQLLASEPEAVQRFWADPATHSPPQGEPLSAFRQRVLAAWRELVAEPGQRVLLISHGGPLRVILGQVLGMPETHLLRLELPLAALSRVRVQGGGDGEPFTSLVFHAGRA